MLRRTAFVFVMPIEVLPTCTDFPFTFSAHERLHTFRTEQLDGRVICIQIIMRKHEVEQIGSDWCFKAPEIQEPKLSTDKASGHGPCKWC